MTLVVSVKMLDKVLTVQTIIKLKIYRDKSHFLHIFKVIFYLCVCTPESSSSIDWIIGCSHFIIFRFGSVLSHSARYCYMKA